MTILFNFHHRSKQCWLQSVPFGGNNIQSRAEMAFNAGRRSRNAKYFFSYFSKKRESMGIRFPKRQGAEVHVQLMVAVFFCGCNGGMDGFGNIDVKLLKNCRMTYDRCTIGYDSHK